VRLHLIDSSLGCVDSMCSLVVSSLILGSKTAKPESAVTSNQELCAVGMIAQAFSPSY